MARPTRDRLLFLRKSRDIERVKATGRRLETPLFNLVSYRSTSAQTQIGIVVSKRLGGAVVRNRARRIFRELARQTQTAFVGGQHILVFPRRKALTVQHLELKEAWVAGLRQASLLTQSPTPSEHH
jgi:ribonuclease P protein component